MSATNRGLERAPGDFYPTPSWLTEAFMEALVEDDRRFQNVEIESIFEPGYGSGAIGDVVRRFCPDARYEGCDIDESLVAAAKAPASVWLGDFLTHDFGGAKFDLVVGNPPYSLAQEFVDKSISISPFVCLLLRINFLGAQKRAAWWRRHTANLAVYISPRRPAFSKNKQGKMGTDATEYAFFVFGSSQPGIYHLETEENKYKE